MRGVELAQQAQGVVGVVTFTKRALTQAAPTEGVVFVADSAWLGFTVVTQAVNLGHQTILVVVFEAEVTVAMLGLARLAPPYRGLDQAIKLVVSVAVAHIARVDG